jgi:hypothetical protein
MRMRLWMGAAAVLAGCNTMTPAQQSAVEANAARSVTCQQGEDCEVKWGKALAWVRAHGAYKISQATDTLITTMGPLPSDPRPSYSIMKTAQGGGVYAIDFDGGCDNIFGCIPSLIQAKADFVLTVMGPYAPPLAAGTQHLGVHGTPVAADVAQRLGLNTSGGVIISTIDAGSPAAHADLKPNDVIVRFDNRPISSDADMRAALAGISPGGTAHLAIWRDKALVEVPVQF